MKTTSAILLAATFGRGVTCQHVSKNIPVVGVYPNSPSEVITSSQTEPTTNTAEGDLIRALQLDNHVTVVPPVELGELLCDTLVDAEDADTLSLYVLHNETIVAEKSSFTVTNGDAFTDGIGRKIWTGIVTDPGQGEDEALPRTVSMVWGDVCDVETFSLKVTRWNIDGTTSMVKTIPCYGSTTHTCMFGVTVDFDDSGEAISPPRDNSTDSAIPGDNGEGSAADDARPTGGSSLSGRRLQDGEDTVIDVMVLYSSEALLGRGGVSADQMETNIIESIAITNEAFVNSEIALSFNAVHIGLLPYEQESTITEDSLIRLTYDTDVRNLRDLKGADLVQMVGFYDDGNCGRGYLYEGGGDTFGTSVVAAFCLDDNTVAHEYGHNLGCLHNREDASYPTEYAHGTRYCDGEDAYRTLMSYWCGHPYVNYFSNPEVSFLGKPTGTDTENNARIIRDNMVDVSNFRDTIPTMSSTPPPTPEVATTYTFIGCFEDNTQNRALSGMSVKGDSGMTTEVCAAFCEESPYFGTEFGVECFCGRVSDEPEELGDASCEFGCAGDASQTCGGPNAITVYKNDDFSPPPPDQGYLGCWEDSKSNRVMDVVQSDSSMTNDLCDEICGSYPFYGTQYGQECWCGSDSTDVTTNGESDACTFGCAGDASQTCGGRFAISIYEHEHEPDAPPPGYLGCWGDSASDRIMDVVESDSSMTTDLCREICSSYAFYGTQFGQECWCGDESTDYTANGESDACDRSCSGDVNTVCGGRFAMSMWESL